MAAVAGSKLDEARAAYETMAKVGGDQGASLGDMGLADLAMYQGEFDKAVPILTAGIARDVKIKNTAAQAAKLVALAEARLALGNQAEALTAVKEAVGLTRDPSVLVPSARVLVAAGRDKEAADIAVELGQSPQATARAYEKLIKADIALNQKRNADAQFELGEALKLADLWMLRLASGIAGVQGGNSVAARDDLNKCLEKRGEATSVFLDDVPSIRYLAPVHYWLGRALEGMNRDQALESYRIFLTLRPAGSRDPLAADARRRLGS
jgi:tetratricopeptide (TPR) repeat protein